MRPYAQKALEFKFALEAGVIDPTLIIRWADETLVAVESYDDDLANVSIAGASDPLRLIDLLGLLIGEANECDAMRKTMALMHGALLRSPSRAHYFACILEAFWVQHGYKLPLDMEFMAGIEDDFQLAERGIFGTVEDATQSLLGHLARYKALAESRE